MMMKSTELPPYAQAMGMEFAGTDNGSPLIAMDFAERAMGRPGFLHGGAIGGLLEMAGFTALEAELERQGADVRIKPINISVEYLRGGLPERIYARGRRRADRARAPDAASPMCGSMPGNPTASARSPVAG